MAGLYVHIPFCVRKCAYCDFLSFPCQEPPEEYLEALLQEIRLAGRLFPGQRYETLFIGGGTPSLLTGQAMAKLLEALAGAFTLGEGAEVTVECNPGTVDGEKLAAYHAAGVNRLSFGLQSANDRLLQAIGRIHTFRQFLDGFLLAQQAGFTNINVDLMYGLPGQHVVDYLDTIQKVTALAPTHISAYSLILEPETPLYDQVRAGTVALPEEDRVWEMQEAGRAALEALGYRRYEISNYARPTFQCRHNLNYWKNGAYLGLGLGAHSAMALGGWRRWNNATALDAYYAALKAGALPIETQEKIPQKEEMFECVMLGLRMLKGVDRAAFLARFGQDVCSVYPEAVEALVALDWACVSPDSLRLTEAGLDMENSALLYFMED